MSPLILYNSRLLLVDNKLSANQACCCGRCCEPGFKWICSNRTTEPPGPVVDGVAWGGCESINLEFVDPAVLPFLPAVYDTLEECQEACLWYGVECGGPFPLNPYYGIPGCGRRYWSDVGGPDLIADSCDLCIEIYRCMIAGFFDPSMCSDAACEALDGYFSPCGNPLP